MMRQASRKWWPGCFLITTVHAQKMVWARALHVFVLTSYGIPEKLMKHVYKGVTYDTAQMQLDAHTRVAG